jgi:hypothetical protein
MIGVAAMVLLAVSLLCRSRAIHKEREKESTETEKAEEYFPVTIQELKAITNLQVLEILTRVPEIYTNTIEGLEEEDRKLLKKLSKEVTQLNKKTKQLKNRSLNSIKNLDKKLVTPGMYAAQIYDYVREIAYCLNYITAPAYTHVNNVHNPIPHARFKELLICKNLLIELFSFVIEKVKNEKLELSEIKQRIDHLIAFLDNHRDFEKIHNHEIEMNTRTTMLYYSIMHETKNMMIQLENFAKSYEEFRKKL